MSDAKEHPYEFGWGIGTGILGCLIGNWARTLTLPCRYHYDPTYFKGDPNSPNFLLRGGGPAPENPGEFACGIVLSGAPEIVGIFLGALIGVLFGFLLDMYFASREKPAS